MTGFVIALDAAECLKELGKPFSLAEVPQSTGQLLRFARLEFFDLPRSAQDPQNSRSACGDLTALWKP